MTKKSIRALIMTGLMSLLFALMPLNSLGINGAETVKPATVGDVNGDGTINAMDVTILRRYLAGGWNVTILPNEADINQDGDVSAIDVTLLRRFLAGGWNIALPLKNVAINETNFPDSLFRQYISVQFDTDRNGELNNTELSSVTVIDLSELEESLTGSDAQAGDASGGDDGLDYRISNLKGIEYFVNLEELDCSLNLLSTIDISQNEKLKVLDCSGNALTEINLSSNSTLTDFDCSGNKLKSLSLSKNASLVSLDCSENELTSLDLSSNPALEQLFCSENELTALNLSGNNVLDVLVCNENELTSLDLATNTKLTTLDCSGNQLTGLDLKSNTMLTYLNSEDNTSISSLNLLSNNALLSLFCGRDVDVHRNVMIIEDIFEDQIFMNYVKAFDSNGDGTLSDEEIRAVTTIDVSGTALSSLEGIQVFRNLEVLKCSGTNITSIDISNSKIKELDASNNSALLEVDCSDATLNTLNVTNSAIEELNCCKNELTSLNIGSLQSLRVLSCYENANLSVLDVSNNTELTYLDCDYCGLSSLNLANNINLSYLSCYGNNIPGIDINNNPLLSTENIYF